MLKALIIDDEQHVRETIQILLKDYESQIMIVGEADDVDQAVSLIDGCKPDVVFLDIHLKSGTGFNVLEKVQFKDFQLVFITAYEQYAIQAFKYSAVNYLLKPIDLDDFKETVEQRILTESSGKMNQELVEVLNQNSQKKERLVLKTQEKYHIVKVDEIIRCEASQNYTNFITTKEKVLVSKTLKEYQSMLPEELFVRCHQSHLVNANYVEGYDRDGFLEMTNSDKVPVSSRKKEEVLGLLFS